MPIHPAMLQRRHWGDGRIRLGLKKVSQKGKDYPAKLSTFRFTSPSREMIAGAAELYGGEVQTWDSPEGKQWQVITNATRIPVILPPNPLTQNMEAWDASSCIRRCDGATREVLSGRPCICQAEDNVICKPTTRLSVLLKDVPSLGTWRLDSHGWNAAAELPGAAEFLAKAGQYVDGVLFLREKKGMHKGQPTRYMVPGLTVEGITPAQLLSGEVPQRYALGGGQASNARAITAGESSGVHNYLADARKATTADQVGDIWRAARDAGHLTDDLRNELNAIGKALKEKAAQPHGVPDEPEFETTHETEPPAASPAGGNEAHRPGLEGTAAEPPSDPAADRLRQQIMATWPGTTTELHAEFGKATGTTMKKATMAQLQSFAKLAPFLGQMGDEPHPPGPIATEPQKASERAEALHQAAKQQGSAVDDGDVVEAEIVEDEEQRPASAKMLRELSTWFGEAGVTVHTGKGSTAKNDEARFAWIAEHLGVTVESTKEMTPIQVGDATKRLMQQAAARRDDLRQRIVNVWSDLGGSNEQLSAAFEREMKTQVSEASNADYAAFLEKLNDGAITPEGSQ